MSTREQIKKQQQVLARCEKSLALEKLKKRRAETRRKIELGGLVVKSGMDGFSKSMILGALYHSASLIYADNTYKELFNSKGNQAFLEGD
ncbi:conjugal transfer protein TraD [Legionella spiritensis]|uniref:Protein TraD n=1 Tax=Legionella spiritensis TaxID=452 RepID=A0A0W0Z8N9_LEGSP|nr:conjugal transfer protein TraD [Legionella spiritensis]KTD65375.1 protein TraD [Legionella spiritensis]SNV47193.1 protein TraD [Legionella spiritensis]